MENEVQWIQDLAELSRWAQAFSKRLKGRELILLSGAVGAGKTTLVRFLSEALGIQGVQSPTFALHQFHESSPISIHHFDLYRIQNPEDLLTTNLDEVLAGESPEGDGLVIVEWPEMAPAETWKVERSVIEIRIQVDQGRSMRSLEIRVREI